MEFCNNWWISFFESSRTQTLSQLTGKSFLSVIIAPDKKWISRFFSFLRQTLSSNTFRYKKMRFFLLPNCASTYRCSALFTRSKNGSVLMKGRFPSFWWLSKKWQGISFSVSCALIVPDHKQQIKPQKYNKIRFILLCLIQLLTYFQVCFHLLIFVFQYFIDAAQAVHCCLIHREMLDFLLGINQTFVSHNRVIVHRFVL